ncbi:MAG: hypothetical protein HZC44_06015, partial [Geobacter sp.]|nr:hypothetical protein [Geobacter sp.]
QMSAGSSTAPGGYASPEESTRQFNISDERSAEAVEQMIKNQGYEVVWKDWDRAFLDRPTPSAAPDGTSSALAAH